MATASLKARTGPGPLACAGHRPLRRLADARAPDHAGADPAADGGADRGHLPAGPQVREGHQPHRSRAAVHHRAGAGGRCRLLLRRHGQRAHVQADAAAADAARARAQLHQHAEPQASGSHVQPRPRAVQPGHRGRRRSRSTRYRQRQAPVRSAGSAPANSACRGGRSRMGSARRSAIASSRRWLRMRPGGHADDARAALPAIAGRAD